MSGSGSATLDCRLTKDGVHDLSADPLAVDLRHVGGVLLLGDCLPAGPAQLSHDQLLKVRV